MKKTLPILFSLLRVTALACIIVPPSLYAEGNSEKFGLYLKLGNAGFERIASVDTELTDTEGEKSKRQTRKTQIVINKGCRWIANRSYIGYLQYLKSGKKMTWFDSPSLFFQVDSSRGASLIDFSAERYGVGVTSFSLRYSLPGNQHRNSAVQSYIYTYVMREEDHLPPYDSEAEESVSQTESTGAMMDLDEGYDSLGSSEDLGATALEPGSAGVTNAKLSMINFYYHHGRYEALGAWYFNHYFGESNLDSNSGSESESESESESGSESDFEPKKTVFVDIWSLFEYRTTIHQLIANNQYSVFLVTPYLGTNPVMLANAESPEQGSRSVFNLLSSIRAPDGGRLQAGHVEFVASNPSTPDRVRMVFSTNMNVEIDLVREPDVEASPAEITPLPELTLTEQDFLPADNLQCEECLDDTPQGLLIPEWK